VAAEPPANAMDAPGDSSTARTSQLRDNPAALQNLGPFRRSPGSWRGVDNLGLLGLTAADRQKMSISPHSLLVVEIAGRLTSTFTDFRPL
jgi:hypothetical protein